MTLCTIDSNLRLVFVTAILRFINLLLQSYPVDIQVLPQQFTYLCYVLYGHILALTFIEGQD